MSANVGAVPSVEILDLKEIADLVKAWRGLPPGTQAVLAMVVATSGSTYRRAGARMLLSEGQWVAGSVSGGCLEADIVHSAWDRTADGPVLVTYDARSPEDIVWGFGLGCDGAVQVLMQRLPPDGGPMAALAECVEARVAGTLTTVLTEGSELGKWVWLPSTLTQTAIPAGDHFLIEYLRPPRPLIIFGAGHDVVPLVDAAKGLGWHVTVADSKRRPRSTKADRVLTMPPADVLAEACDDQTAAVVMTHNFVSDLAVLEALLASPVGYIGLMGPKRRSEKLIEDLARQGVVLSDDDASRIFAPIGLDLGSEEPCEIALSIVAEIQAFFSGHSASPLREVAMPLHERRAPEQVLTGEVPICGLSA